MCIIEKAVINKQVWNLQQKGLLPSHVLADWPSCSSAAWKVETTWTHREMDGQRAHWVQLRRELWYLLFGLLLNPLPKNCKRFHFMIFVMPRVDFCPSLTPPPLHELDPCQTLLDNFWIWWSTQVQKIPPHLSLKMNKILCGIGNACGMTYGNYSRILAQLISFSLILDKSCSSACTPFLHYFKQLF